MDFLERLLFNLSDKLDRMLYQPFKELIGTEKTHNFGGIKEKFKQEMENEVNMVRKHLKNNQYIPRSFCRRIGCFVQSLLDDKDANLTDQSSIKEICKKKCSVHKFHAWLREQQFKIIEIALD